MLRNQEGSHRQFVRPAKPEKLRLQVTNRTRCLPRPGVYTEAGGYVMSRYLIIYEKSGTGYGAYAPDLPGCVATGRTLDQTKRRMTKAIEMHLSAMREDGDEIPKPSRFDLVEVA